MGSCLSRASSGAFLDPVISVSGCKMKGIGFRGVNIECSLKISNPNITQLDGTNISYKIRKVSDGTVLSEGDVPREFKIGPSATATVKLPVKLKYGGVSAAGASLVRRGETNLEVEGHLTFVAFVSQKGTVDIPYKDRVAVVLPE